MKKFLFALVAATLVLPSLAGDFPKGSPKFEDSYRKVMADAKKSGKPAIVHCLIDPEAITPTTTISKLRAAAQK